MNSNNESTLPSSKPGLAADPPSTGVTASLAPIMPDNPLEKTKESLKDAKKGFTFNPSLWNTSMLPQRIAGDIVAAGAAGGLVAPLITMIDQAIIENASNRRTISESLKHSLYTILTRPHRFFLGKPFGLIFMLYGGTYLSANSLDTFHSTVIAPSKSTFSTATSGTAKFVATSATNLSLCLYKDTHFTKLFGASKGAPKPIPLVTMGLFALRDSMTVFASFNLPPLLAPKINLGEGMEKYITSASVAQFTAPAAAQIFSTPMHLLGLDFYNRPGTAKQQVGFSGDSGRMAKVTRDWLKACLARVGRIVPAFGFGGVVNTRVRRSWMQKLEESA